VAARCPGKHAVGSKSDDKLHRRTPGSIWPDPLLEPRILAYASRTRLVRVVDPVGLTFRRCGFAHGQRISVTPELVRDARFTKVSKTYADEPRWQVITARRQGV